MADQSEEQRNIRTEERRYLKPVAWLGGRDLLANLKYFLLFAAFKGKLDPRDWMTAEVFPPPVESLEGWQRAYVEAFNNSFQDDPEFGKREFWFDYLADSGDGMTAGYALAYLCLSDLEVRLSGPLSDTDKAAAEVRSRLARGEKPRAIASDYQGVASAEIIEQLNSNRSEEIIAFIEERVAGIVHLPGAAGTLNHDHARLPRGAFLFVGGDTSYHVADFAGLGLRFQRVFEWAFNDLKNDLGLNADEADARYLNEEKRHPLFGIPGNHDYYDMVDGFNRQFREPMTRETNFINLAGRDMRPQLRIPSFKRVQKASYVAIKLPFDWWFWGIDSELPRVDLRQQEFFKRTYSVSNPKGAEQEVAEYLGREPTPEEKERLKRRLARYPHGDRWPAPRKLIVATSEPGTVEGRREPEDGKTPQAFSFLDLTRPFLYPDGPQSPTNKIRDREIELGLVDFQCRLDISGDVHHYARYWGDESSGGHYASLVSGGGGASMSPTQTDYGEVPAQAIYPSKRTSRRVINKELFKPWVVFRGGNVWLAGFLIAMISYFGANFPEEHYDFTQSLVGTLLEIRKAGLAQTLATCINYFTGAEASKVIKLSSLMLMSCAAMIVAGGYARWMFRRLTKTHDWVSDKFHNIKLRSKEDKKAAGEADKPKEEEYEEFLRVIEDRTSADIPKQRVAAFWSLFGLCILVTGLFWLVEPSASGNGFWTYAAVAALLAGVVLALAASFKYSRGLVSKFKETTAPESKIKNERHQFDLVRKLTVSPKHDYAPFWGLLILSAGTAGLAFYKYQDVQHVLPRIGHSALILFSIFVVIAAAIVAIYYSKWLFEQSYRIKVHAIFSYIPVMFITGIAFVIFAIAIWLFGRYQVRHIITDLLFLTVLLAVPVGCILLAALFGNHVRTFPRTVVFGLLGVWHGLLQLVVPFLLVWVGKWYVVLLVLALVLGVRLLSVQIVKQTSLILIHKVINRGTLVAAWLAYGLIVLALPLVFHRAIVPNSTDPPDPLSLVMWSFVTGLVGALMCCVWLGWYFATALEFKGHANEAGSTARTENYKQFIRFKITENELTGYVIAVDYPHAPYSHFKFRDRLKQAIFGKPKASGTGASLKPRLVDVFTLRCRPCPVTGKPLPRE